MDIQLSRCAHLPFAGKQARNYLPHLFPTFRAKSSLRNAIFLTLFSTFPEQRQSNVSPASSCIPPVLRSVHMSYHQKNTKSACVSESLEVSVLPGAAFPQAASPTLHLPHFPVSVPPVHLAYAPKVPNALCTCPTDADMKYPAVQIRQMLHRAPG